MLNDNGTSFTFPDIPEGDYEIRASIIPDGRPPRADLYIADIRAGGRSVFDTGFQVGLDAVDSMEIVLGTEGGSIKGRIQFRATTQLVAVVVVPESFLAANAALYRIGYFRPDDEFKLTGIAPGNYKVFAVPYFNKTLPYRDPEFAAQNDRRAIPVTIQKGTTITGLNLSLGEVVAPND